MNKIILIKEFEIQENTRKKKKEKQDFLFLKNSIEQNTVFHFYV